MKISPILVLLLLISLCSSQECLNHQGEPVNWFVVLTTPRSAANGKPGYHYFDSSSQQFAYHYGYVGSQGHPIYNTLEQLNNQTFSKIFWNDQVPSEQKLLKYKGVKNPSKESKNIPKPRGQTAHAKTIIGYNLQSQTGIVIAHSVPYYPYLIGGHEINKTIHKDQTKYGQHLFCFNSGKNTKEIISKAKITNPHIYFNTNNDQFSFQSQNQFQTSNFKVGNSQNDQIKIIYKNSAFIRNIFTDGLTKMFQSDLVAQTWDRSNTSAYCNDGQFKVQIAKELGFQKEGLSWRQGQDHSKWAIPINQNVPFVCFGDMNVMKSQNKRGGAFYCIKNQGLKKAMIQSIKKARVCSPNSIFEPFLDSESKAKPKLTKKPRAKKERHVQFSIPENSDGDIKAEKIIQVKKARSIKISVEIVITDL